MILRMIGLNTSALRAKNTTTTAEQKFHSGKNQKSGWKGICLYSFQLYKEQIFLSTFQSSWAYLLDYCYKRLCSKPAVFLPLLWPLALFFTQSLRGKYGWFVWGWFFGYCCLGGAGVGNGWLFQFCFILDFVLVGVLFWFFFCECCF